MADAGFFSPPISPPIFIPRPIPPSCFARWLIVLSRALCNSPFAPPFLYISPANPSNSTPSSTPPQNQRARSPSKSVLTLRILNKNQPGNRPSQFHCPQAPPPSFPFPRKRVSTSSKHVSSKAPLSVPSIIPPSGFAMRISFAPVPHSRSTPITSPSMASRSPSSAPPLNRLMHNSID